MIEKAGGGEWGGGGEDGRSLATFELLLRRMGMKMNEKIQDRRRLGARIDDYRPEVAQRS